MEAATHQGEQAATPSGADRNGQPRPMPTQKMRAVVQREYGSADTLRFGEIDLPVMEKGEVLLRVHAAGLDRGTWHLMAGKPYLIRLGFGFRGPKNPVPGLDVAGTVVAVGEEVTRFQVGDEVFGVSRGSFAEYACAREDKLAKKPESLPFEQAAVVSISALTALQGLRDHGRVEAGQKVLIVGASGGVGTYAVQLAKEFGAEVTGVCSGAKVDLVRSIGADHVIDYEQRDFADGAERYDLILDIGGNSSLSRLRRALTQTGTLVIVGGEGGGPWFGGVDRQLRALAMSPFVSQRLTNFIASDNHVDMEYVGELIEAGKLVPTLETTYPLEQAPDAMRHLVAGRARGKVAIKV